LSTGTTGEAPRERGEAENVRAETSLGLETPATPLTPVTPTSGARVRVTVTVVTLDAPQAAIGATREDVVIEAPAATPVREILARLRELVDAPADVSTAVDGTTIGAGLALGPFGGGPLRDGAVVSVRPAASGPGHHHPDEPAPRRQPSYVELRVVGGPSAGDVHLLAMGATPIGRASGAGVRIDDPTISRHHAVLTISADAVTVSDAGSTNGTTLDGEPVGTAPLPMQPGMRLRLGESTLIVAVPDEAPVAITPTCDGRLSFNRPPRLDAPDPAAPRPAVEFPVEPIDRAPNKLPLVATLAPLLGGVALAAVMRRPEYLLFTVLSPVMMASQWASDRRGHRKGRRAERAAYAASVAQAQRALADALSADAHARRHRAPDPAALAKAVGAAPRHRSDGSTDGPDSQGSARARRAPGPRLWERRPEDADFLVVSVGLGTLPADVDVAGSQSGVPLTQPAVCDVPVTVSLPTVGVLGVAGSPCATAPLARAIIGQLVVLHSPRDLGVVLLAESARAQTWEWVRWLPHLRPASPVNCQALLGLDAETTAARVAELCALIESRRALIAPNVSTRAIVVIVDGAQALRRTPALAQVLSLGPAVGVFAICIDEEERRLPEECRAVVRFADAVGSRLSITMSRGQAIADVTAYGVSTMWADHLGRALSPLRDDSPDRLDALPEALRWLDIAGPADIGASLLTRWRNTGAGSTKALIGAGAGGEFVVDIARDGPHALIAGTTGSGKSELLQTFVASLALANRPDELTFVLVDYKGGAAFGACATLPHTVGMVTDLDGRLVERALTSLTAELKRREALLGAVGAADIVTYHAAGGTLARLVIVVDEFASLAEELPGFVGGLVGVAQRGRSLGVHLVLATQRPEGAVSADIRANANLRICLAVMRESESRDVIDSPAAARISRTTPGRGYARTGHGELVAFQSGRVGGRSTGAGEGEIGVRFSPFRALCKPAHVRPVEAANVNDVAETDLDRIVAACREAQGQLAIVSAPSPWLPPLPEVIPVSEMPDARAPLTAVLGVVDAPALQARQNYVVDLSSFGHLVIGGSARSGRTTALRTLIGGLAMSTSTEHLHVYAIDCSGGSLATLAAFPHCGAVIAANEPARAGRLFATLTAELDRRQSSANEPLSSRPAPHIALLIDGWEAFTAAFDDVEGGAIVDACMRLIREGASARIHVVVTADRAALVGRLASSIENRLVLRLADRTDFSLIGLPIRAVPVAMPAGRCFVVDSLLEMQVCVLGDDPSRTAQLEALAVIAVASQLRDSGVSRSRRPRRIDPLPLAVTVTDIDVHDGAPAWGSGQVTLGVGGDELGALSVDLLEVGPGFLVAGPHRSGRSTALATIAVGLRASGWHVVAVTPRPSIVRNYANDVFDTHGPGLDDALALANGPLAVVVDDAELVTDSPVAGVLDAMMRAARDAGHIVVIAGSTDELAIGFRGFLVDARRARSGILLNPRSSLDGEVLGVRLPRSTGGSAPAGRGLLVVRGSITQLQVALPASIDPADQPQTVTERVPIATPPWVTVTLTTPSSAPV
jgi:DNA segregation ATPase FtsK/SpoIIIE, S-DNA-T family